MMMNVKQVDLNDINVLNVKEEEYYIVNLERMTVQDLYYERIDEIQSQSKDKWCVVIKREEVKDDED